MKRLFISIFILIMITALSVCCLEGLKKDCGSLCQKLDSIAAGAHDGTLERRTVEDFDSKWEDFAFKGSIQLNSLAVDQISTEVRRLDVLAAAGSCDLTSQCAYLKEAITSLCQRQMPTLASVL